MKIKTLAIVSLALTSSHLHAASYIFNNGSSATASGFVDLSGNSFRSATTVGQALTAAGTFGNWTSAGPGVVAVGLFNTDVLSSLNKTDLIAAFTNTYMTGTFGAGPSGQRGTFSLSPPAVTITGSIWADKHMYVFAGNGTTLADSTQFAVLKGTATWKATDDAIPTANTITFGSSSTLLFGTSLANVGTTNTDASTTPGFGMLVPVPEPSSALLGALGAIGLLRRRRN